jgi:hypothetical protein
MVKMYRKRSDANLNGDQSIFGAWGDNQFVKKN